MHLVWRLCGQLLLMGTLLVVSQLMVALIASAAALFSGTDLILSDMERIDSCWGQLLLIGSGIAVATSVLLAGRILDRRRFRSFGFSLSKDWWVDFSFGLGLGALLMILIFAIEWKAGWIQIQEILSHQDSVLGRLPALVGPVAVFLVVGFYEELFNRGYLIKNITEGLQGWVLGPRLALLTAYLISAVIFGLLHLANPNSSAWTAINISLAGLFLGLGFVLTGELAIPIGLHISWNIFQGVIFGFPVSGASLSSLSLIRVAQDGPELWTGGNFGPEGGLIGTLAILLGIGLSGLWIRSRTGNIRLALALASYRPRAVPDPSPSGSSRSPSANPDQMTSRLRLPDILVWDWNGTLLDDLDLCLDIINRILESRRLPALTQERYQQVFDFPIENYYQRIGFDFSREPFEDISTEFITAYERRRSECRLMSGAKEALEAAALAGLSQSIISASKLDYLNAAVKEYGIEAYFERIMGLDNHHAAGKQALVEDFLASTGADPERVLIIGDTTHDAAIASSLGIPCILIPNGHHSRGRLKRTGAALFDSLSELTLQLQGKHHDKN